MMKYKIGDLVVIKKINPIRPSWQHRSRVINCYPSLVSRFCQARQSLKDTWGIIIAADFGLYNKDDGYVWYSQVDAKEYHFYEDEVAGGIIE
jgi:hypothetical protein